ncbi:MAG TPA: hypothetical protein VNU97_04730 [Rhizomicrobium sp.]|jgi:hypothetical protein|nr:hypothetical protein [Rhizomicrobium sp.]
MKTLIKAALGALMFGGAMTVAAAPADAHVSIGIGIGGGGGYYGPPAYAYCDRYSRWYDPYRCDEYDDAYDYYNGPVFVDGIWLNGGYRSRFFDGHRQFFYRGGWHGGSGFHSGGFSHGGGGFGGGHGGSGHHHH